MCFDQHTVEEKRPLLAAGALYMPAGTATEPLGRGEGEADAQLVLMNHYRMKAWCSMTPRLFARWSRK